MHDIAETLVKILFIHFLTDITISFILAKKFYDFSFLFVELSLILRKINSFILQYLCTQIHIKIFPKD